MLMNMISHGKNQLVYRYNKRTSLWLIQFVIVIVLLFCFLFCLSFHYENKSNVELKVHRYEELYEEYSSITDKDTKLLLMKSLQANIMMYRDDFSEEDLEQLDKLLDEIQNIIESIRGDVK